MVISDEKYYVYALLDPRKNGSYKFGEYEFDYEPFYIGKGCGRRYLCHEHKSSKRCNYLKSKVINECNKSKLKIIPIILVSNLSEMESLEIEMDLISKIGRRDENLGSLTNLTNGGESGGNQNMDKMKKPITSFDLKTFEKKEYSSLTEASELSNISIGNISNCCKGKITYCGNKIFEYKDTYLRDKYKETRNKLFNKYKIIQHLGDKCLIFDNMVEAAKHNNVSTTCILNNCLGKIGKHSNYDFEYCDEDKRNKFRKVREKYRNTPNKKCKPVVQLSLSGELVKIWDSSTHTRSYFNPSTIISCCRGRRNKHKGFKWMYKSDYENKNNEKV